MEEINEENITKLLVSLPHNLNAIERMIMVNEGTVQTFLSVLCNTPVKVEVISQYEIADVVVRWSKLVAIYGGEQVTVCLAESIIPTSDIGISNAPDFITMVYDREKGIGQIIKEIGFETTRHIKGFHSDAKTFARTYTIDGPISLVITEVFNRETIAAITGIPTIIGRAKKDTWVVKGAMDINDLCDLVGYNPDGHGLHFGGVQPKEDTTSNTKVGEVAASEQPIVDIKEGDSE